MKGQTDNDDHTEVDDENERKRTRMRTKSRPIRQWARVQKLVGNAIPSPRRDVQVGRRNGARWETQQPFLCLPWCFSQLRVVLVQSREGIVFSVSAAKMQTRGKRRSVRDLVCAQTEVLSVTFPFQFVGRMWLYLH